MVRRIAAFLLGGLARLLSWLPLPVALACGRGVGALLSLSIGTTVARRIDAALPGRGRRLARAALAELGMNLCEFMRVPYRPREVGRVELRGLEHLPAGGAVLLAGHYGNFELMGWALGQTDHKLVTLVPQPTDPLTYFVDRHRQVYGFRFIHIESSVRGRARAFLQAVRLIEEGYIVSFMADTGWSPGLEVEVLGRRRWFDLGGELMAQRTQRPVVASFITRTPRGHLVEILPLPPHEPTKAFAQMLDERVQARPEQFYWT